jgi:hypothetical protein
LKLKLLNFLPTVLVLCIDTRYRSLCEQQGYGAPLPKPGAKSSEPYPGTFSEAQEEDGAGRYRYLNGEYTSGTNYFSAHTSRFCKIDFNMRSFLTVVSCAALLINSAADDAASDTLCLVKSAQFGVTDESAGVLFETFGFILAGDVMESLEMLCGDSPEDCDLEGTDFSEDAKANCLELGGKLFLDDLSVCSRAIMLLGDFESPVPPDVNFKNVPICLDPSCEDDIDIFAAVGDYVPLLPEGTGFDPFKILLDEEKCKEPDPPTSVANARNYRMASSGLVALAIAALLL